MNVQGGALTAQARPGLTRNLPSRAILTVVLCVDPACRLCVCVCVRVYVYVYQYHMCACVHVCMCLCLCVCVYCVCVHRLLPTGGVHSCGLMHPLRARCRHARADTARGACLPLAPSRSQLPAHSPLPLYDTFERIQQWNTRTSMEINGITFCYFMWCAYFKSLLGFGTLTRFRFC